MIWRTSKGASGIEKIFHGAGGDQDPKMVIFGHFRAIEILGTFSVFLKFEMFFLRIGCQSGLACVLHVLLHLRVHFGMIWRTSKGASGIEKIFHGAGGDQDPENDQKWSFSDIFGPSKFWWLFQFF